MRKRLFAWAAGGLAAALALKRGVLFGIALTAGAAVVGGPADLGRGLAWLQAQVQSSGGLISVSKVAGPQQAGCETAATLLKLGNANPQVAALVSALYSTGTEGSTETLACWQQLRQQLGLTAFEANVEGRRVGQEGYSAAAGFGVSNSLDTGWALAARLHALPAEDTSSVLAWLQRIQAVDGSFAAAGRADLVATGVILRGLKEEASRNGVAAAMATKASSWLLAQRNAQGNWLDDVALTALVFEAVHPYTAVDPGIASTVEAYLLGGQRPDGSWQGDPYVTALALRALALTSVPAVDPTLAATASVRGVVTAAADGRPLAGASVRAQSGGVARDGVSDAQGRYLLQGIAPGSVTVTASLPGYQSLSAQVSLDMGAVAMFSPAMYAAGENVPATGVIKGRVVSFGSNVPLAGVTVQATGAGQATTTTDAQGRFEMAVAAGAYTLTCSLPAYVTQARQVLLSGGASADVDTVLLKPERTASTLRGVVMDVQGQPLAGATVNIVGGPTAVTGASGSYSFADLGGLQFAVRASASGYATREFTLDLVAPGDLVQDVTLPSLTATLLGLSQAAVSPRTVGRQSETTASARVSNTSGSEGSAVASAVVTDPQGNRVATLPAIDGAGNAIGTISLLPGADRQVFFKWSTGTFSAGSYILTLRLHVPGTMTRDNPDGVVFVSTQTSIDVTASASFHGSITANPPVMRAGTGTPVKLSATIQNDGNVVLPAQGYTLSIVDTATAIAAHTQSLSSDAIAKSQLRSLTFNDWTPPSGGNFRLELTSPSTPGARVTTSLYVGDSGMAAFTADKAFVPIGTQQVRGSVKVVGQEQTGTITDPLEPMIRAALVKSVAYADRKAFDHTTNDLRCYACHVQTQALVGGELNLKFTQPTDALRRAMLVSQITQNIDARGAINNTKIISSSDGASLSTVGTSVANTSLGLWGLTAWHDPASVAATRVRTAVFLAGAQRSDGSWWPDNPTSPDNGWWRTPAPLTAINAGSFAALKAHLQGSAAPRKRTLKPFTALGLNLNPGSEVRVNADSDGTLYLASWPQRTAWKVSNGVATQIATGRIWNARPLGGGRVLLATDDGVRIREANGTINTLNPAPAFDAKPWGDRFLVTSGGAIHSMDASGTMATLISDPVLLSSSAGVAAQADGRFLVPTYYGRKVARFDASGQYVDTPVLLDEWEDWGLWLVPHGEGYLVGSEKGLFQYNKDWVAERWSNTRTVSAAPLPDGRVIAYMGSYPGGLYEITDDGPIDVAGTLASLEASIGKAATWLREPSDVNNNIDLAFRLMGLASAKKHYEGTTRAAEFDAEMQSIGATLRSRQRSDGGWVWKQDVHTTSDSMVTAMVGMALDTFNPSRDAPEVRKAIELLLGRQREDGSWLTENEVVTQWRTVNGVRILDTNLVLVPSTWVEIWLPTVLDRVGRIDTDLSITFAPNTVMSNPDHPPTSATPMADGAQTYVWKLTGLSAGGTQVNFDVELKDMQADETRPVARAAYLVSRNTFVPGTVSVAVEVPKVTVGTSLTPSLHTDKPSYTASDHALFTAVASNGGAAARDAQVRFSVLDATGQVVDVLPLGPSFTVPPSGTTSIAALWPAAGILSGSYQVKADLISPTGLVYGTATASFAVTAGTEQATSARIGVDRLSYDASQTVHLASRVANLTANAPQEGMRAVTAVLGALGQEVFTRTEAIAQLAAGNQLQYDYAIAASGLGVGAYQARLQLLDSRGTVLSQGSAGFAVVGTDQNGVGLTGQLQATPSVAPIGQPVTLRLAASNNGNAGITGTVKVRVLEPQGGTVLGSFSQEVTAWSPGAAQNFEWAWTAQGLDGQTMVAVASAVVNGHEVGLGQAVIRLVGIPQLRAQPAQLDFTSLYVGEAATRTLTLASVGTTGATSLTFSLGGADPTQYVITQDGCTAAASVPLGASCTVGVNYRPHTAGTHTSELRVAHRNGEPVVVPLLGQAKPVLFRGTVGTDPQELEAGQSVSLNYSVSNPANSTARMMGNLNLLRSNGQSLAMWPLDIPAGPLASIAGNQSYATAAEGQTLTVALSQQLGSSSFVLATSTFTVLDPPVPLEVSNALKAPARVLVLVSCPPGLGAQDDAACVERRSQSIVAYLGSLGLGSKAVATGDAFVAEMRCGSYNTYWISGGAVKLDAQSIAELREAIYRGEALWMDGVHDSRNQLLHPVAGVKELGKLPTNNQLASLSADSVYGQQVLSTLGQPGKFELVAGQAQGLFTQVPGEQSSLPAVVSNVYGQGRSLLFAFDLAAMVSADDAPSQGWLGAFVNGSASYTAAGSPTLTVGDLTGLSTSVTNQGTRTVVFRAEASLPASLTVTAAVPASTVATDTSGSSTVTWVFSLSGGSTQLLNLQLRALEPGSYEVPLVIYSLPGPGSILPPKARYSGTLPLDVKDAASLLHQALEQVMAVQPTVVSDKSDLTKAMDAVGKALTLHNQGSHEQALAQWVAAADALATITSADTASARRALSLAMEATTDALCIQRCGSAACQ